MKKRFNINLLMSFLSKKGALLLGLFAGAMIVLLSSIVVNAEELKESDKDSSSGAVVTSTCLYAKSSTNTYAYEYNIYIDKDNDYLSKMCCFENAGSTVNGNPCVTVTLLANYTMSGTVVRDGVTSDFSGTSISTDTSVQSYSCFVYQFATLKECQQYLAGELDASCALNFDKISESNSTYGFDSNVPYYDNASFANNVDDSAQYTAKMSSDMQSGIVSGGEYYISLNTYALYFSNDDMTVIEKMAMKGLENDAKYPFIEKYLTYDSEGRLTVNYAIETSGSDGFSGGGGRHSLMLTEDSGSKLVAVPLEIVDITDKYPFSYTLTRNMMAQTYDGYHHVGYASEITIYKKDGLSYSYGKTAYSYTWIYDFMRENFGNETYFTDDKGSIDKGNSYSFDSDGSSVDVVGDFSSDSFNEYIENGFGLAGKDGYLEMLRHYFLGVPDYIWEIIAFALVWNLVLIMVMALRGM